MGTFPVFNLSATSRLDITNAIIGLISKIENESTRDALIQFFDVYGERYFSAPASTKAEFHNAFECGLAEHSLRVYKNLMTLISSFDIKDLVISQDSIILVSLLHDIGKIGDEDGVLYGKQDSQWHKDNYGQFYTTSNITHMDHAQRSLYIIANIIGIKLTKEEYIAILIHDGWIMDQNKTYMHKEPWLATLLQTADYIACKSEKDRYSRFVKSME